jgi:lipopolysaccharide heptosyltransferase II
MNIRVMKAIDRYIGIPVCFALDFIQMIASFFSKRAVGPPEKILIMKYFGMGSIILASPLLRAIKNKYPAARIGFLTFDSNQDIVERLALVDVIYALRTDSPVHFVADLFRNILRIRHEKYDITIDMEFFAKFSTIMTYISGSTIRIGYFLRQMWRGNLLTHQIYYNHYKHITEVFGALASPLGIQITDYSLTRPLFSEAENTAAGLILEKVGVRKKDLLIGFNVNVSDLSLERRWPMQEFQALAKALLTELNVKLVFVGATVDRSYVDEVLKGLGRTAQVVNLAGKTSLGELIGVFTRLALFVTNDSGPLHIAAALDVPTLSFFGPETPVLYGPKGGDPLIFYKGLYCSPCLSVFNAKTAPCNGRNICMQSIRAEAVLETMRERLNVFRENSGRNL